MKKLLKTGALVMFAGLAGCASITEGTDQQVTVDTDPSGATCNLSRGGETVGVVNPTPGTVTLSKSKDDVSVECKKEGYQTKARSLNSEFEGMTFGNIIFGGIIGVGVDAASGAMNEYPNQVRLILPPNEFPDAESRSVFFERRERKVRSKAKEAIAKVEENCGDPDVKDKCAKAIEKIKERREDRLAEIEADKAQANVATGS